MKKLTLEKIEYPNNETSGYGTYCYSIPAEIVEDSDMPAITVGENENNLPVVAIIMGRDKHPDRETPDYTLTRWAVESLLRQNLFPAFITYKHLREQLDYWRPRGIVLSGGSFHFPYEWLNYKSNISPAEHNLTRCNAWIAMLEHAIKNKLPTMGLCGGMQVMAGYLGGKLMGARFVAPESPINHHSKDTMHSISVAPGSMLYKIAGGDYLTNSFHNSCLSPDFIKEFNAVATAEDGIIEAIEPKNPWSDFVFGAQWHPEKMAVLGDEDHPDAKLFRAFADAVARR